MELDACSSYCGWLLKCIWFHSASRIDTASRAWHVRRRPNEVGPGAKYTRCVMEMSIQVWYARMCYDEAGLVE